MQDELQSLKDDLEEVQRHGCNACWDCLTTLQAALKRAIAMIEEERDAG